MISIVSLIDLIKPFIHIITDLIINNNINYFEKEYSGHVD